MEEFDEEEEAPMTQRQQDDAATYRLEIAKDDHSHNKNNNKNLFVRLSPDILSKVVTEALQQLDFSRTNHEHDDTQTWHLVPEMDAASTTFLPLEMIVEDEIIYASFNGGILEEYQGKDPMDCCHSFFCSCCWS